MAGCAVNYTQEQACEKEDLGYFDGVGGRIAANESLFAEIGGHASANATERQAIGPPCRTAEEFSRRSSASGMRLRMSRRDISNSSSLFELAEGRLTVEFLVELSM